MNIRDNVVTKIYNKLFSDELDYIKSCNHLEYIKDTRLKLPQKEILVVSTPKERFN